MLNRPLGQVCTGVELATLGPFIDLENDQLLIGLGQFLPIALLPILQ
jgi:hypothetical protein